ncbi:Got1/Sft2-like vescicle transport protein family [Zea mays]|uniref:Vesicle transport protein n=1 Tax=Zea mays TaxID=4577 RepID=A0A1D6Q3G9_MAIZE|nr:Got1/Sft2-like vescicle transport protein family [Zea mays]
MDTMRGALERAKMLVGMEVDEESALPPPEEQSFFDDINRHCTLNTTQAKALWFRDMLGCRTDVHILVNACLLQSSEIWGSIHPWQFDGPWKNHLFGSTAFLIGPKRQFDMMLDSVRIYATAIYIASIIIALFCAIYVRSKLLTLVAIILEFGALIWYSLSYIPFARSIVSKVMTSCFDTDF